MIFLTGAVAEGWGGVAVQLEGRRSLARYGRTGMRAKSKIKKIDTKKHKIQKEVIGNTGQDKSKIKNCPLPNIP